MRTLYILRHAKSDWPSGVDDIDRPLNERGRRDANSLANLMCSQDMMPDYVWCSPAKRTRQTFAPIHNNFPQVEVSYERSLYLASVGTLYEFIKKTSAQYQCAMVIGHNPGMEGLVRFLTGDADVESLSRLAAGYKTGCLSKFQCDIDTWENLMPSANYLESVCIGKDLD